MDNEHWLSHFITDLRQLAVSTGHTRILSHLDNVLQYSMHSTRSGEN